MPQVGFPGNRFCRVWWAFLEWCLWRAEAGQEKAGWAEGVVGFQVREPWSRLNSVLELRWPVVINPRWAAEVGAFTFASSVTVGLLGRGVTVGKAALGSRGHSWRGWMLRDEYQLQSHQLEQGVPPSGPSVLTSFLSSFLLCFFLLSFFPPSLSPFFLSFSSLPIVKSEPVDSGQYCVVSCMYANHRSWNWNIL